MVRRSARFFVENVLTHWTKSRVLLNIICPVRESQSYLMDGRNLANDWFRIMITASKGCWVLASSGTPSKDPSGLRVLAELPTFTPTQ